MEDIERKVLLEKNEGVRFEELNQGDTLTIVTGEGEEAWQFRFEVTTKTPQGLECEMTLQRPFDEEGERLLVTPITLVGNASSLEDLEGFNHSEDSLAVNYMTLREGGSLLGQFRHLTELTTLGEAGQVIGVITVKKAPRNTPEQKVLQMDKLTSRRASSISRRGLRAQRAERLKQK